MGFLYGNNVFNVLECSAVYTIHSNMYNNNIDNRKDYKENMLNVMILEGYIKDDLKEVGNETFKGIKFILASKLPHFNSNPKIKYMYVNTIAFGQDRVEMIKKNYQKGDFVTIVGKYSYTPVGKKYFPQLILEEINKNFASGSVPTKEAVSVGDVVVEDNNVEDGENW